MGRFEETTTRIRSERAKADEFRRKRVNLAVVEACAEIAKDHDRHIPGNSTSNPLSAANHDARSLLYKAAGLSTGLELPDHLMFKALANSAHAAYDAELDRLADLAEQVLDRRLAAVDTPDE